MAAAAAAAANATKCVFYRYVHTEKLHPYSCCCCCCCCCSRLDEECAPYRKIIFVYNLFLKHLLRTGSRSRPRPRPRLEAAHRDTKILRFSRYRDTLSSLVHLLRPPKRLLFSRENICSDFWISCGCFVVASLVDCPPILFSVICVCVWPIRLAQIVWRLRLSSPPSRISPALENQL